MIELHCHCRPDIDYRCPRHKTIAVIDARRGETAQQARSAKQTRARSAPNPVAMPNPKAKIAGYHGQQGDLG